MRSRSMSGQSSFFSSHLNERHETVTHLLDEYKNLTFHRFLLQNEVGWFFRGSTNWSGLFRLGGNLPREGGVLNSKEKINAIRNTSNETHIFSSAGESFSDGCDD